MNLDTLDQRGDTLDQRGGGADQRVVRIANCSGYYGDRLSAVRDLLEGGDDLDYITGDYLAELTMLILGRDLMKDASLGYAKTFVTQMTDTMALAKAKGVRIVTNAGGLNPAGLATKLREIAAEQGHDIAIAYVEGDNLQARAAEFGWDGALTANAYLGAFGIAAALTAGADIVVTGRVTDASVVMGPAIAEFGWERDHFDQLAGALVAGHVIECSTQATGGNFAGFRTIDTSRQLGLPIAELSSDGTAVITKQPGTGGAVTVDTVTAQLVYEIQGTTYLNPDVAARLDTLRVEQVGADRVSISGAAGSAPPPTTKVCLNYFGGFRNSFEMMLTGLDIEAKAEWLKRQLEDVLDRLPRRPKEVEWQLDRTDIPDPSTQAAATAMLRLHVKDDDPEIVGRAFTNGAVELALASIPGMGLTKLPEPGTPYGYYRAGYVSQVDVPHVVVHADGRREDIPPPPLTAEPGGDQSEGEARESGRDRFDRVATSARPAGRAARVPLGDLAYARSGDKGGDANIGVWIPAAHPRRAEAFAWLDATMTPKRVRELLPEAANLDVEVHHLPNLAGLNIIIHGLLGEGVASSTRQDPQAKALGEWLRARHVLIPEELLESR